MRKFFSISFALIYLFGFDTGPVLAQGSLSAVLADEKWNGQSVPADQVCNRHDGKGSSPKMQVSGIPDGVSVIIVEFNDESFSPMNNGGHGVVGVAVPRGAKTIVIPRILGHSDTLPAGVQS